MVMSGRELDREVQLAIVRLCREGQSQRSIAKRLGLCRRTVQKYLAAREDGELEPTRVAP